MLPLTDVGDIRLDLNYLYHRHQVSLFRAANGATQVARRVHSELADGYASLIATARAPALGGAA